MSARFVLPPRGTFRANNDVDPLRFYYTPVIGRVFAARLDVGLRLLDGWAAKFGRVLEVGYGSGLLLPTLASLTGPSGHSELHGLDREPPPEGLLETLDRLGTHATLRQGELAQLPYADGYFDLVVAFSVLEHLRPAELPAALSQLARVCSNNGHLLVGCPAVHGAMNAAFAAIGFPDISNHHFSGLPHVLDAAEPDFVVEARAAWPAPLAVLPCGWAPYGCVLLRRRAHSS